MKACNLVLSWKQDESYSTSIQTDNYITIKQLNSTIWKVLKRILGDWSKSRILQLEISLEREAWLNKNGSLSRFEEITESPNVTDITETIWAKNTFHLLVTKQVVWNLANFDLIMCAVIPKYIQQVRLNQFSKNMLSIMIYY